MAVHSRVSRELFVPNKWSDDDRVEMSMSPKRYRNKIPRKVAVVYYLVRNGHLEQPHFIEVSLSSNNGLYLKDVINKLNSLRGHGMAYRYSWSSKRSYKSGYVWQDLSDDDLIHPTNSHDYVLKGSELLHTPIIETSPPTGKNNSRSNTQENRDALSPITPVQRKRNQSWSSFENNGADDRHEYAIVYKCESSRGFAGADAATQTEEKQMSESLFKKLSELHDNKSVELSREELSPPSSISSSNGSDVVSASGDVDRNVNGPDRVSNNDYDSIGKWKSWMQLMTCGSSLAIKYYGPVKRKEPNMKAQLNK